MERSTAEQALFPGEYDVGARVQLAWRFLRVAGAVMNGDPIGERAFPLRDPNHQKDWILRAGVETPVGDMVWLTAGFSALWGTGFHRGTPTTKGVLQWTDKNEDGAFTSDEIVGIPGTTGSASSNFSRFGWGPYVNASFKVPSVGLLTIYGEAYVAKNLDRAKLVADPAGPLGRDTREIGAYGAVLLQFFEYANLGVRYDMYNPDRDSTNPSKPIVPTTLDYSTLSVVGSWGTPNGRVAVEYDHNKNHDGRDLMGLPASRKDDSVIIRGQVGF
jgi:hypothetical protein